MIAALEQIAGKDDALKQIVNKIPKHIRKLMWHPEQYIGNSEKIAERMFTDARETVDEICPDLLSECLF